MSHLSINPGNPLTAPFLSALLVTDGDSQAHVFIQTTPEELRSLADQLEAAIAQKQVAA